MKKNLPQKTKKLPSREDRRIRLASFLFYLFFFFGLAYPSSPLAAPPILEDVVLEKDTSWSGDIHIKGVVVVGRGSCLTIKPGSRIFFHRIDRNRDGIGDSELRVLGRLVAEGTKEEKILFTSAEEIPRAGDWSYVLLFTSGQKSSIDQAIFRYGFSGLQVHFSSALVTRSLFENNNEAIRFGRAHLDITECVVQNNNIGIRFTRMEGPVVIRGNRITANRIGIFLVPSGQNIMDFFDPDRGEKVWNTGRLLISGNDIHENIWYNLSLGEKQTWDLDVRNNWWGSGESRQIKEKIFDRQRDSSLGTALIEPFARQPFTLFPEKDTVSTSR